MPGAPCRVSATFHRFYSVIGTGSNLPQKRWLHYMRAIQSQPRRNKPQNNQNPTTVCQTEQISCFPVLPFMSTCCCSLPWSSPVPTSRQSGDCCQRLTDICARTRHGEKHPLTVFLKLGKSEEMGDRATRHFGPGHSICLCFVVFLTDA